MSGVAIAVTSAGKALVVAWAILMLRGCHLYGDPSSCVLPLGYPYSGAGSASRRWSLDIDGIPAWDVQFAAEPTVGVHPL